MPIPEDVPPPGWKPARPLPDFQRDKIRCIAQPLGPGDASVVAELTEKLRIADPWTSVAVAHRGTCVIGLRLYGNTKATLQEFDRGLVRPLPWGWELQGFGAFSITFFPKDPGASPSPRIVLLPGTPEFSAMEFPNFRVVLFEGTAAVRRFRLETIGTAAAPFWNSALADARAAKAPPAGLHEAMGWLTLNAIGLHKKYFKNRELLKVGWAEALARACSGFQTLFAERDASVSKPPEDSLALEVTKLFLGANADPIAAASVLYEAMASQPLDDLGPTLDALHEFFGAVDPERVLMGLVHTMGLLSPKTTRCGERTAWLTLRADESALQFIEIDPTNFSRETCLQYFHRVAFANPPLGTGRWVGPASEPVPLDFGDPAWKQFPKATDPDAASAAADALLDEASTSKSGTIPPAALVQPAYGPFSHFVVYEKPDGIWFVATTPKGEYAIMCVEPDTRYFYLQVTSFLDPAQAKAIKASLKLFLAGVIRDFWVVETREQVFATRNANTVSSTRGLSEKPAGPRIVYLPRIRYEPGDSPQIGRMREQINPAPRRPHNVAQHFRKTEAASQQQLDLARFLGIEVPHGFTFVRAHHRGTDAASVIYRSRSAMRSLYTASEEMPPGVSDWFVFERTVMKFMEKQGFDLTHHALDRNGDQGIDLRATKGRDLDLVLWAIQCKCYGVERPVGVDAVRELLGALIAEPAGTRGMLVTTSTFTSGARILAGQHNIRLIDGPEFAKLSGEGSAPAS